ncbi:MAG: 2,3-bisphosphoglycerate-independent phosphoglycerate mutase [Candidatus Bathyarchaeia archaeon]
MNNVPKTVFAIIDGFGFNPDTQGNAILAAKTPNLDHLWSYYPHTLLKASEEVVGLSFGQMGNSEVGHMALGTARVVASANQRITESIQNGSFFKNEALLSTMTHVKKNNSRLHLIGMISTAGVHADVNQMIAVIKMAKENGITNLILHPILDGRDTRPKEAQVYLDMLTAAIKQNGIGTIATISGRGYAMDRNNNWGKTRLYYEALVGTSKTIASDPAEVIKQSYTQGLDDETVVPTIINPNGKLDNSDATIITNFRGDRARQITHALVDSSFKGFTKSVSPSGLYIATMTNYEEGIGTQVAFSSQNVPNTLSHVIEQNGLTQLHIAETEKYAHVTYFFKGGQETKLPHEDSVQIPSDPPEMFLQKPEMKAREITDYVLKDLDASKHDVIIINFANPDMIGHTGNFDKTVKAIEAIDECMGKIAQKVLSLNGSLFIVSDHGNSEQLTDVSTHDPAKEHTTSPVPFIKVSSQGKKEGQLVRITTGSQVTGILQDVAPSILTSLNISVPTEMTGVNLFD